MGFIIDISNTAWFINFKDVSSLLENPVVILCTWNSFSQSYTTQKVLPNMKVKSIKVRTKINKNLGKSRNSMKWMKR